MTSRWYVPRRTVLRGLGTAVALPFLEAMAAPKRARAGAVLDPRTNPRRFVGMWGFPCGLVHKWDPAQNSFVAPWTPKDEGPLTGVDEKGFLAPFFDPQNKGATGELPHEKLTILTGLSDVSLWMHQGLAALLSPGRLACGGHPAEENCQNDPLDVRGPTADQVLAAQLKPYTDIPYLALGADYPGSHYPYEVYISWKDGVTPAPRNDDPADVFDKLFADTTPTMEKPEDTRRRKLYRKSVMDTVLGHARTIQARVGADDRKKLDQYFEGIQELEKNIDKLRAPGACSPPVRPTRSDAGRIDKRAKLMMDLMVKGFECDRTRVATLALTNSYGCQAAAFLDVINQPHHDMSHYISGKTAAANGISVDQRIVYMDTWGKWVVKMLAYFAAELDKRIDPDGSTLLDNSAVFMSGDCGDADAHSMTSMNSLLVGRAGRTVAGDWGIRAGRHVRCSPAWPSDHCMYWSQDHQFNYDLCREPDRTYLGASHPEEHTPTGGHNHKDLLWGLLDTFGVPAADSKKWVGLGRGELPRQLATSPLDLKFPGKK